jgi:hypothetical protein
LRVFSIGVFSRLSDRLPPRNIVDKWSGGESNPLRFLREKRGLSLQAAQKAAQQQSLSRRMPC